MFIGEFQHTIDEKGRISMPAKFRGKLTDGCVITRGLDNCLWVYTSTEWVKIAESVSSLPITQKNSRSFARFILSGAMEAVLDKAGRINLPGYLRQYAGIKSKVVVTGMYNRIEIWPDDAWNKFKKDMEENSESVAERIAELGF